MLKNVSSLGSILNNEEKKAIKGSNLGFSKPGWCSSNCSVQGADCSEMFGPTKTCNLIPCDGDYVLACY